MRVPELTAVSVSCAASINALVNCLSAFYSGAFVKKCRYLQCKDLVLASRPDTWTELAFYHGRRQRDLPKETGPFSPKRQLMLS